MADGVVDAPGWIVPVLVGVTVAFVDGVPVTTRGVRVGVPAVPTGVSVASVDARAVAVARRVPVAVTSGVAVGIDEVGNGVAVGAAGVGVASVAPPAGKVPLLSEVVPSGWAPPNSGFGSRIRSTCRYQTFLAGVSLPQSTGP